MPGWVSRVEFGAPVCAVLRTSRGHPLLWVAAAVEPAAFLESYAQLMDVGDTSLDWSLLSA